jgi:hypothetical protein
MEMVVDNFKIGCYKDKIVVNENEYTVSAFNRCRFFDKLFSECDLNSQMKIANFLKMFYSKISTHEASKQHNFGEYTHKTTRHRDGKTNYKMYKSFCIKLHQKIEELKFERRRVEC